MISIHDLSKTYDRGATHAVRGVSFDVGDAEIVALLGSSGSGKTTVLKMINRLVEPSAGRVQIDGRNASTINLLQLRREIGYVFQNIGLFPHMSVLDNAAIGLRIRGVARGERRRRAKEMLEFVGLDPAIYADRLPRCLSGGQQQRVGIARALAPDPKHLLMDEPFGALDAVTRDALQQEVLHIKQSLGKSILLVTHDCFEALRLADRIGVMHEGRLEQFAPPQDIVRNPATPFVAGIFESAARQAELLTEARR